MRAELMTGHGSSVGGDRGLGGGADARSQPMYRTVPAERRAPVDAKKPSTARFQPVSPPTPAAGGAEDPQLTALRTITIQLRWMNDTVGFIKRAMLGFLGMGLLLIVVGIVIAVTLAVR